jgi:hypothetical protein
MPDAWPEAGCFHPSASIIIHVPIGISVDHSMDHSGNESCVSAHVLWTCWTLDPAESLAATLLVCL